MGKGQLVLAARTEIQYVTVSVFGLVLGVTDMTVSNLGRIFGHTSQGFRCLSVDRNRKDRVPASGSILPLQVEEIQLLLCDLHPV